MSRANIKIARLVTACQREQLYKLRADVFFGERILHRGSSCRFTDELDSVPSTSNFVALNDGRVVGGCRVTVPCDEYHPSATPMHDFSASLGDFAATTGSGSMLCIDPEWRGSVSLGLDLVATCMAEGVRSGMTHSCAAVRPSVEPLFERLGWTAVAPCFIHESERVPVLPMVADLRRPTGTFARFLRRQA